jgi:ligand-binding sensor domain-containing protein
MRLARRLFRLALAFAALICPAAAHAQSGKDPLADYTLTTWNENDGLPAGRIRAIAQDADGYLWLGTDAGLVRFDGVRFDAWRFPYHHRFRVNGAFDLPWYVDL